LCSKSGVKVPSILITGASGFLGGHLAQTAAANPQIIGLYQTFHFSIPGILSASLDLSQPDTIQPLLDQLKPEIIIHNAALANPDRCEQQPELAFRVNVIATGKIAEWCQLKNARLIYISTDMVFDGEKGNYSETDQPNPVSVYGQSKATAEQQALTGNPNTVVCRIALMYGRGIFRRNYSSEWLERELLRRAAEPELPPLNLYSDQYRSMLAVNNAARVILELAESDFYGILHVGGAERLSRFAFGEKLCRKLDLPSSLIQPVSQCESQPQARRPRDVSLNISRAQTILKTPLLSVDAGLNEAYQ